MIEKVLLCIINGNEEKDDFYILEQQIQRLFMQQPSLQVEAVAFSAVPLEPRLLHFVTNIHSIFNSQMDNFGISQMTALLLPVIRQFRPDLVLACANYDINTLLTWTASSLKAAAVTEARNIRIQGKCLCMDTAAFGGKAMATLRWEGKGPYFATVVRTLSSEQEQLQSEVRAVTIIQHSISRAESLPGIVRLAVDRQSEGKIELEQAGLILSGGRGLGKEQFELLKVLANQLGAAVGASRAVVDQGWIPQSAQVGLTGKIVSPQVYVAFGIHGAPQHVAGMAQSGCVVAVNHDPQAPIFEQADFGIVADAPELLQQILEIQQTQGGTG